MSVAFGKSWFRAKKRLTETWDENRARKSHENRELYVAVVGGETRTSCFVEINNDYVGVGFLDATMREYLSYQFQELKPGQLFLTMATHREFESDSDTVRNGTTYYFNPEGAVTIESEEFSTNTRSIKEIQADVAGNWEAYPAFGDYRSIIRENR